MKYKIAVCVSGQPRTYINCLDSIATYFSKLTYDNSKVEVDYFMHTWDSGNVFYSGPDKVSEDENGVMKCDVQAYKPTDIHFNSIYSKLNIKDIMVESSFSFRRYATTVGHWDSLFYSFKKSIDLKKKYEEHNNFKYDLVFKIRPDIVFNPECIGMNIQKLNFGEVVTTWEPPQVPHELNMYNVDDIMFGGTSETIDKVSDIYEEFVVPELNEVKFMQTPEDTFPRVVGPGVMLHEFFKKHNLKTVLPTGGKFQYIIYRLQALEKNLNPFIDIEEIFRIHQSYYNIIDEE